MAEKNDILVLQAVNEMEATNPQHINNINPVSKKVEEGCVIEIVHHWIEQTSTLEQLLLIYATLTERKL
jgi:hypothetical protein